MVSMLTQRAQLAELLAEENNSLWAAVLYGIGVSDDTIVAVALSQVGNIGRTALLVMVRVLRGRVEMVCLLCELGAPTSAAILTPVLFPNSQAV